MIDFIAVPILAFIIQVAWISWMLRFCRLAKPTVENLVLKIVYAGQFVVLILIAALLVSSIFRVTSFDVSLVALLIGGFLGAFVALKCYHPADPKGRGTNLDKTPE